MKNLLRILLLLFTAAAAARASVDTTPPVLSTLSYAPGAVDVSSSSATIAMNVVASDSNGSGVDSIDVEFVSPSGKQTANFYMDDSDLASGTPISGTFSSTTALSTCSEPGTWTLKYVSLSDQCGDSVTYESSASGSVQAFPAGIQTAIEVTNTSTITSTPQLVSLTFTPSSVDLTSSNHTVTVTAELSDSTAGVSDGYFYFESSSGDQTVSGDFGSYNLISGNAFDGIYQTVITFGTCDGPGNWTLKSVSVEDPCNNVTSYGLGAAAFPNGTPTLITVTNPNADTTPPAFVSLGLSSTVADVTNGEVEITGSAVATDNASGVSSGQVIYTGTGGSVSFFFDSSEIEGGTVLNGTFGGTMDVGPCVTPGVYTLKNIYVYDACGNSAHYGGSGSTLPTSGVPASILVVNGTLSTGSVVVYIYPESAEYDGYTWNVDGGNSEFNGATVTGVATGAQTVNFLPLNGFTTPSSEVVEVVAGQTTYTSGTYIAQTPSDAIQVNILPSGVGGMWSVDNGPLQASGATVSGLYDGGHTIQFSDVSGYTAPAGQVITTASNLTFITTGTYSQVTQFGSISCNITPSGAVHNGAQWNVDGGASQSSGSTVSGLAVGQHSVNFTSATGYTTPESQVIEVANDATTSTTGTYAPSVSSTGSLTVTILPAAAVKAGAEWNVDGNASEKSGGTISGISGGNHTVNFTMVGGYVTPASQVVSITPNATTATTGTYTTAPGFTGAAQSFAGLSASGNALLTLSMTDTGKFTGKFEVDGAPTLALSGSLTFGGGFTGTAGKKPAAPYTLQVTGTSSSTYLLTGSADGVQITAYPYAYAKGQTVAELGKYNSLLYITTSGPGGTGYGTITVSKTGVASVAGKLADGTGFTASNALVAGTGGNAFIIYDTSLYAKKGLLSGMLTFVSGSGSASGDLNWVKPPTKTAYYAAGFDATLLAEGQLYVSSTIPFTTGTVSFLGASLQSAIIEPFSVAGSKITITGTSNPADVTLKITSTTGAVSGTLLLPGSKKPVTVKYSGLLLQTPGFPRAGGFFLTPVVSGSGQSGQVLLPYPPI